MSTITIPGTARSLVLAAAAVFALSIASGQRAEAISLFTPGASPAKAASSGLIQVRGGHGGGGHGGGGFHGGGFHGGGFHAGAFHGGGFHTFHGGGFHHGFAHFHHRRFFFGGYYPYYDYPHYCRVIWTYYGPHRVCGYHHWYRWHRRHHWRRHYW